MTTECYNRETFLKYEIGEDWLDLIEEEFKKPYFSELEKFLQNEMKSKTILPSPDLVFAWTKYCSTSNIKVVILAQDPYPTAGLAQGIAFSVPRGKVVPQSLKNIFQELETDINDFKLPAHGDLSSWAKQGVLLLNTVLTVREGSAGSHKCEGWENLTDAVIKHLDKTDSNIVFMLWGGEAQEKGDLITNANNGKENKKLVLKTSHPSNQGAYRGFKGCKHFSQANTFLKENGCTPINWGTVNQ